MTLQSKLYPLLDDKSLLDNVSPNYRFMNRSLTNSIGEFYTGVRFSKSVRHRSNEYINYSGSKPISDIYIFSMFDLNSNINVL